MDDFRHPDAWTPGAVTGSARGLLGHLDCWAASPVSRHHDPQVTASIRRLIATRDAQRPRSPRHDTLTDVIDRLTDTTVPRWAVLPPEVQTALILAAATT